jgi:IPT/TIG domain
LELYKQFKDIEVLIGGVGCVYAVVVNDNKITCDPPATDSRMIIKDGAAQVMVKEKFNL